MQPDFIGANETEEIDSKILGQPLQFCGWNLSSFKDHVDEHGWVVAPIDTDLMIDPLYERITLVVSSQAVDSV